MKTNLNRLGKGIMVTRILLVFFVLLFAWVVGMDIFKLARYGAKDESAFTVAHLSNYNGTESDWLMIDGERHQIVDLYQYDSLRDGTPVYKQHLMINQGIELGKDVLILTMLILLFVLSCGCGKGKSPFTMRSVHLLRIIAILTLCVPIVPEFIGNEVRASMCGSAATEIDNLELYMMVFAAGIGMLAEIFRYGIAVQEDSDSIA